MKRFYNLVFILFLNIMMSNVDMLCSMFNCWINITAWLSKHSGIGPSMGNPISPLKNLSHAACHPVLASSVYSASPTDNVTIFCHWDTQDIALFAIRKCVLMCPDDHLCVHPNLSWSIWLTQHLNFHHIWFWVFEVSKYVFCILDMFLYWVVVKSW